MVVQGKEKRKTLNQGSVIDLYKTIYSTMDLSNKAQPNSTQGLLAAAASTMGPSTSVRGNHSEGKVPWVGAGVEPQIHFRTD